MSKSMKKFVIFILIAILLFSLSACDYSYRLYKKYRKETLVVSIELVNYNNPMAQENPLEKHPFDLEKLEIFETLSTDSIENFLVEISEIGGTTGKFEQALNSPCGIGIRITYQDGGFTLISVTFINGFDTIFVGEYNADANISEYFGIRWRKLIDDFKAIINEYFTTQI